MRVDKKNDAVMPEWRTRPERSNIFAMRLITWVALTLGRRVARLFLTPICVYFLASSPVAVRSASRNYLQRVLGRKAGWRDLYRHFYVFSATILDRVYLFSDRFDKLEIHLNNGEALQAAMAQGRGCILLGSHVGSFEAVRGLGRELSAPPANMVMFEENARKLSSVLNALNPELMQYVIEMGKQDSMIKVRDALARGEYVGILADRVIEGEGGVVCDFLGTPAKFPSGPLRMAAMLKVPVLVMAGLYMGGNRYEVYFEPLPLRVAEGNVRHELLEQQVQDYARQIEKFCQIAPYNWFNFYDFWA